MRSEYEMSMLQKVADKHTVYTYLSGFGEIREAFVDKFNGNTRKANAALASALSPRQSGVPAKKDLPYQAALRNVQRYDKGTIKNPGKGYDTRLKEVGKTLPPVGKKAAGDIHITVTGTQDKRERTIKVTLKGPAAYRFVNNPSYREIWEAYDVDAEIFEGEGDYGSGGIDVVSVA